MTTAPDRLLPNIDRDSAPFWAGLRAGEIRVQRCDGCGAYRWPARVICNRCRSFRATWVRLAGTGTIMSWTRTHQIFSRAFETDVPYVNVLVRLDEQDDIQMIGRFSSSHIAPRPGMRVRAVMTPVAEDISLLLWEPVPGCGVDPCVLPSSISPMSRPCSPLWRSKARAPAKFWSRLRHPASAARTFM